MADLREQLAQRLAAVVPTSNYGAELDLRKVQEKFYGALADECLRQMEWARHECSTGPGDSEGVELDFDQPLTLAPEDWKP